MEMSRQGHEGVVEVPRDVQKGNASVIVSSRLCQSVTEFL